MLRIKVTFVAHEVEETLIVLGWSRQLGECSLNAHGSRVIPEEVHAEPAVMDSFETCQHELL